MDRLAIAVNVGVQRAKTSNYSMRPIDVTPTIADKLLNMVYSNIKAVALVFKVGDLVRVSKFKTIFEKHSKLDHRGV